MGEAITSSGTWDIEPVAWQWNAENLKATVIKGLANTSFDLKSLWLDWKQKRSRYDVIILMHIGLRTVLTAKQRVVTECSAVSKKKYSNMNLVHARLKIAFVLQDF